MRVLFLSRLFSPFQIEVANAVRDLGIDYRIAFTMPNRAARMQPHWAAFDHDAELYPVAPEGTRDADWLCAQIDQLSPDVLLVGQPLFGLHEAVLRTWRPNRYILGYWMEPPDFRHPTWRRVAGRQLTKSRIQYADFVLSIGERAERAYLPCAPRAQHFLIPYGADLSRCLAVDLDAKPCETTFLYSGQLRPHHDIGLLANAIAEVERQRPGRFRVIISGDGPERYHLDNLLAANPGLVGRVTYDSEFASWSDRLRPFEAAHVMLYPCVYTGWGLVVPEAMAAGLCVISTRNAEAALYYIRHRANGIIATLDLDSFVREMLRCIDDPRMVRQLGEAARQTGLEGHAPSIASRLQPVLEADYPKHTPRQQRQVQLDVALSKLRPAIGR